MRYKIAYVIYVVGMLIWAIILATSGKGILFYCSVAFWAVGAFWMIYEKEKKTKGILSAEEE